MKPIQTNVLAIVDNEQEITDGIDAPKNDFTTGTVVSVGDGDPEYPKMICKPGDRIKWSKHAGEKIIYEGQNHILLNEKKGHILAIL